jgi:hypothetical protein
MKTKNDFKKKVGNVAKFDGKCGLQEWEGSHGLTVRNIFYGPYGWLSLK